MKSERVQVTQLPPLTPREILSVPIDCDDNVASQATVYAGLQSRLPPVGGTVAVSLVAGLLGHRQTVATVGIPPGFDGLAVTASGIVADAWHVEAFGGGSDVSLSVALGVRHCCSGFAVFCPPELQSNIPQAQTGAPDFPPRVLPLGREHGAYRVIAGTSAPGPGAILLDNADRVLRIVVSAGPAGDVAFYGFPIWSWVIPSRTTQTLEPRGNQQGPAALSLTGDVEYYSIEVVR